jgi:uncharacterized phiE125 gp8 family phage protein
MGFWDFNTLDVSVPKYQEITLTSSEPAYEPVTVAQAKNYLKVDTTNDDTLIESLIIAARKQVENECGGLVIVKRNFTQKQTGGLKQIELLREPINSISSITFYEEFDSTGEVLSASNYRFVGSNLYHVDSFFQIGRQGDGYQIVFNAGMVDDTLVGASTAPHAIKTAILRYVGFLYENREEYATNINEGNFSIAYDQKTLFETKMLLMPYHTGKAVI